MAAPGVEQITLATSVLMLFTSNGEDKKARRRRYKHKVLTSIFGEIENGIRSHLRPMLREKRASRRGGYVLVGLP